MNNRVDFYILPDNNAMLFVCKLLEKTYEEAHRCFVYCENEAQVHALDELIWTYENISFIPHNIYGEGPTPPPPIQLGHDDIPREHRDILINLTEASSENFFQFKRIIEIVPNDEIIKIKARDKFRFYRQYQCQLSTHDLTK